MSLSRIFILSLAVLPSFISSAHAEKDRTGNGGVAFMCKGRNAKYDRNMLVDFYEVARYPKARPWMKLGEANDSIPSLIDAYIGNVARFEGPRARRYRQLAEQIFAELSALERDPGAKTKLVMFSEDPLNLSGDSDEVGGPENCPKVQVVTQIRPDQIGRKLLEFHRVSWEALDPEMQVFTVFHEINLMEARNVGQTLSSRNARYLNSIFGSTELAQSISFCNYYQALNSTGFASRTGRADSDDTNWGQDYFSTLAFHGELRIEIGDIKTLTCHPDGNLASASLGLFDYQPAPERSGQTILHDLKFDGTTGLLISSNHWGVFDTKFNDESVFGKDRRVVVFEGSAREEAPGTLFIDNMRIATVKVNGSLKHGDPTDIRVRLRAGQLPEILY